MKYKFVFTIITFFSLLSLTIAGEKKVSDRQKVIDFEGDLVEGINKRPLDSLSQVSEAEKRRKKAHLYRKRKGFRTETQETVREVRYVQ